ncbi:MAG: type II secretion system protein GspG [Sedimentisphaeraceae bacterium JB056]
MNRKAFSLQEILVVMAIIAVMTIILVTGGLSLRKQADIRVAENTVLTLSTALDLYYEKNGQYPFEALAYLPDSTDPGHISFGREELAEEIMIYLGYDVATTAYSVAVDETRNYQASIEALYYFLQQDPATRETLDSIPNRYVTAKSASDSTVLEELEIDAAEYIPLIRVVDPWGSPYRYIYEAGSGVAKIESAGPDGEFGRNDAGVDADEDAKNFDNISN